MEEELAEKGLNVEVSTNFEGETNRIIGFRLSIDSDGGQHGADRCFGEWNGHIYPWSRG